jgi:2'-5' RNA ligase
VSAVPPQQDLFGEAPAPRPRQSRPAVARPPHEWFFAVRPSAADAARIHAYADGLLASHDVSGQRVGPDRLHISLDSIGHDVDAAVLEAAYRAADTVRLPAFEAMFEAALSFHPSNAFVLVGDGGLEAVRPLRTALGCALADQGFSLRSTYEPHMTLCYDRDHRVARTPIAPIGFRVAGFALVKSHIGFSRHEVLRTWPLAG